MSTALFIPMPQSEADARVRSEALYRRLKSVLQQVLDASSLLGLQLSCPLLLDGPIVVERPAGNQPFPAQRGRVLSVTVESIPATQHVPAAELWVSATSETALAEARVLPMLLATVMESEQRRLTAENTARGALEIANRDPATGLGNRRAWLHALQVEAGRAQRSGRPLAVLVLDIDGLKAVNDALGHAAGDDLIVRAANVLSSTRRATDEICRLGGDEFGVAAPDTDPVQARLLASRVRRCLQEEGVRVSLGWAVSAEGSTLDDIWQQADTAMYEDKRARRG